MATLPGTIVGDIQWFEERVSSWSENAASIGLTLAQAAAIGTETGQARSAFNAANAAKTAYKDSVVIQNAEVGEMRSLGGQLITTIRAFAEQQPDTSVVYALASVPPKQSPSSVPPVQPTDVSYDLTNTGSIELKWKGTTAGGTVFSVVRAVQIEPGEPFGAFEQVGLTGSREFLDGSIPPCCIAAQYVIRAFKGAFAPVSSDLATVRFTPGTDSDTRSIRYAA